MSIFAILHLRFDHEMLHLFANTAQTLNTAHMHTYTLTLRPHCAIHYTTALPTHTTSHITHCPHTYHITILILKLIIYTNPNKAPNTLLHIHIQISQPHTSLTPPHTLTQLHTHATCTIYVCMHVWVYSTCCVDLFDQVVISVSYPHIAC